MSEKHTKGNAAHRRARFATMTAVLLTASTASMILIVSLASRVHTRIDVTATRAHSLSARTREILEKVETPHRIVVSVDRSTLDPRSAQRITDLLGSFEEASPRIEVVEIDTSSPSSIPAFTELLEELADEHRGKIETQRRRIEDVASDASQLARDVPSLDTLIKEARDAYDPDDQRHRELNRLAGMVRRLPEALETASEEAETAATRAFAGVNIPDTALASERVVPALQEAATVLETSVRYANVLMNAESRDEVIATLESIAETSAPMRDTALLADEAIRSLDTLDALDVARALRTGDTVLIINPDKVTAIDFRSLFPPTALIDATGGGGAEITFAGEELIASALASINNPRNPVLVFTHGQTVRILDGSGKPTTYARRSFGSLLSRLRLRGFSLHEWHTATEETRPSAAELDPTGERPIVWFVFGPPTADGPTDAGGTNQAARALRLAGLAKSLAQLVRSGEPFILSLGLSDLASLGQPDPLVDALDPLGVDVRTDLMLLRRVTSASGREAVFSEFRITRADADHPIAEAVDGLAVTLPTPKPIAIEEREGIETTPLLTIENTDAIYGESEWSRLPHPVSQQPLPLRQPPDVSESRDALAPESGDEWTVATSSVVASSGQRAVVIGSHVWFADLITQRQTSLEGRNIWVNPGNLEFFEASVYWLAGLDEMIAPSPHTLDVPRIKPLDSTQLALIRWTLIVILPVLTLLVGVAARYLRP